MVVSQSNTGNKILSLSLSLSLNSLGTVSFKSVSGGYIVFIWLLKKSFIILKAERIGRYLWGIGY